MTDNTGYWLWSKVDAALRSWLQRGADKKVRDNVDNMIATRSVGDVLHMMDGVTNANLKAAAARTIVSMCAHYQAYKVSTGLTREVLKEFGSEMEFIIDALKEFKPARTGWIIGTMAFCMSADKKTTEFLIKFSTGENLARNDAAKTLRDWMVNAKSTHLRKGYKKGAIESVANTIYNGIQGTPITQVKAGSRGMDYFLSKKRGFTDYIKEQMDHQMEMRGKRNVQERKLKTEAI